MLVKYAGKVWKDLYFVLLKSSSNGLKAPNQNIVRKKVGFSETSVPILFTPCTGVLFYIKEETGLLHIWVTTQSIEYNFFIVHIKFIYNKYLIINIIINN